MASVNAKARAFLLREKQSVLVTGGARSGKSRFAEEILAPFERVAYLATAQAGDAEMAERILQHRTRRDPRWITIEEPVDVIRCLAELADGRQAVLLDCVTLWISNLMGLGLDDTEILTRAEVLGRFLERPTLPIVCVTNEVGSGIVPDNALGRRFRDLAGQVNQCLAQSCHKVVCLVSGIPMKVK
jgi:adenosylcobinamide kinase/adenosylcobinamide-phosphate guanylyltransferase